MIKEALNSMQCSYTTEDVKQLKQWATLFDILLKLAQSSDVTCEVADVIGEWHETD